jgi:hypothetical protein
MWCQIWNGVDNIIMDLREVGWEGMNWIDLAQDRDQWRALVNTVMNLQVQLNARKFLSSCTICGFSRRAQLRKSVLLISSSHVRFSPFCRYKH